MRTYRTLEKSKFYSMELYGPLLEVKRIYVEILLRQVSTGNLLYSPNRRSFITKTATTNFKADEFTDPFGEWLKHLCSVMADSVVLCYGMRHGIVYCISGMVLCVLFYVVWNRVVKCSNARCMVRFGVL